MTADTSHNDGENEEIEDSPAQKHVLIGVILGIILLAVVLNRSGFITFEKKTQNNNNHHETTNGNNPSSDVKPPENETTNVLEETLYKRFTKKPMNYYQYDAEEMRPEFGHEAFEQFKVWLSGKNPGNVTDSSASIKTSEIPMQSDKIVVNSASTFPETVDFPEDWTFTDAKDEDSVLCIVIPPTKSPMPSEYWIKFILLKENVGKVYSYTVTHSKANGFVWKFSGISFE